MAHQNAIMKGIKAKADKMRLIKQELNWMFERRHERLLPRHLFIRRLIKYALISVGLIALSLVIGIIGYHTLEGLSSVDSFPNAVMLMGRMGPVNALHTANGKIFAGIYALYCGLIEIVAIGIFASPIFHRFLHHFHLEAENK